MATDDTLRREVERRMQEGVDDPAGLCGVLDVAVAVDITVALVQEERKARGHVDTHIYCTTCGTVPLIRDFMPADERNNHAATDLLCSKCHLIIATIHHVDADFAPPDKSGGDGE